MVDPTNGAIAAAWGRRAGELADKFLREYVNRIDVCGAYKRTDRRKVVTRPDGSEYVDKVWTWPAKEKRGHIILNRLILTRHFEGLDGNIRGLHSTSESNTCKWGGLDIDAHEGQPADLEANWLAARTAYEICVAYGLAVLLTDSNGKGGYHLLVAFAEAIPAARMYAFLRYLVSQLGVPTIKIETFPKQAALSETKKYGNWLRMPGHHHTYDEHWSRVWDGEKWLDGEAAVNAILSLQPNAVRLFDAIEIPAPPPSTPTTAPKPKPLRREGNGLLSDAEVVTEALKLIDPNIHYDDWIKVGQACHSVGVDLLGVWESWSQGSPKFTPGLCAEKWKTFSAGNGGVTIRTLIHMARDRDERFLTPGSRGGRGPQAQPKPPTRKTEPNEPTTTAPAPAEPASPAAPASDPAPVVDPITTAIETKDIKKLYAAIPEIAKMPFAEFAARKSDLKSAFGKELNLNDLQRSVSDAKRTLRRQQRQPRRRETGANLPSICVSNRQMREITDDSLCAFADENDPPLSYMRSAELVHLKTDEKRRFVIKSMTEAALRARLERSANYYSIGKDEEEIIQPPPLDICRDILSLSINDELERLGKPTLPPLEAIVESPVLRLDGTILTSPGYDPATSLYFAPSAGVDGVKVPMRPTAVQLRDAVALVDEVIGEFPYEDEASAANAKAALLSPFIRHALIGRVPVAIFDKPQPGTGGSLLAEAIETIATGRDAAMWGAPENEDEWRKLITSILREGHVLVIIDNVEHALESDALARVITCAEWGDRILGESREIRLPARATWFVTGNNVQLGRNLARRCYQIRMNAKVSQPWRRNGFKHPNLIEWIRENRGRILGAVLTICRAWYAAGKPQATSPVLGSFENWSKTVGGILAHAGVSGFLGNLENMHAAADEDGPQWEAFLLAWEQVYGTRAITVAEVEKDIPERQHLRESLPSELGTLIEHQPRSGFNSETYRIHPRFKMRLGKALQKRVDMRFGESSIFITRAGDHSDKKVAMWSCLRGVRGVPGSVSGQSAAGGTPRNGDNDVERVYVREGEGLYDSPALPRLPVTYRELKDEWLEYFNERAAVLEFEAGESEEEARQHAFEETLRTMQNRGNGHG